MSDHPGDPDRRPPDSPALAAVEQALQALGEHDDEPPAQVAPRIAAAQEALAALLDEEPATPTTPNTPSDPAAGRAPRPAADTDRR